ncbi:DUF2933 domain-containing protein [Paenibacillus sp. 19GGS1-52]|uniref:DUF2933 domain-containing protein n=1 Tax=Paenibacillus sp. 19GGS1-52 TaxID=2758563 RepID=UPI001EFC0968|nr:DUF2933 domain-containing protein [Paenibacillus sp. 19GGS1-52]ULO08193.1 DUF2933 domain-containing protein [Paenibacillus sp. 19GGS1-52]
MNWSWLITLVCPLMMIFMMFGMRGSHGHGSKGQHSPSNEDLVKQLNELKLQNEKMSKDIQSLTP